MLAKEKKITLEHHVPPELSKPWADSSRFEQVATNLITNAIKVHTGGRAIDVFVEEEAGKLRVFPSRIRGSASRPEHQEIIFDRFRQVRSHEKNESSHTGHRSGIGHLQGDYRPA